MKTLKKPLVYVALALVPMLFSKCTLSQDLDKLQSILKDSVQIYVGTPQFNTLAHIQFVDAATNLPIEDKDVKVTIFGKDAASMYNNMGKQMSEYTSKWGMLDLVVDPHKTSGSNLSSNPLEFIVTPKLDGYVGDPQKAILLNSGTNTVTISMVNLSAPPAGYYNSMSNVFVGKTNSNGQISGSTQISQAPRKISNGSFSADIYGRTFNFWFQDNTTLLDSLGNTLVGEVYCDLPSSFSGSYLIRKTDNLYKLMVKTFEKSIRIYVKSTNAPRTPVANFGNNGGIIYQQDLNNLNYKPNPINYYDKYYRLGKKGDKFERWQTKSLQNYFKGLVTTINSKNIVVQSNDELVYGALILKDTLKSVSDLDFTLGFSQTLYPVEMSLFIDGQVTKPSSFIYDCYKKIDDPLRQTGDFPDIYSLFGFLEGEIDKTTGSTPIIAHYLTTDIDLVKTPDYFGIYNKSDGLTVTPVDFSKTPDFSTNPAKCTQVVKVVEDLTWDLVTAIIDLTVVNQSNPSIGIKPNVNIQVEGQTHPLYNGKTTLMLKLGQTYSLRGVFGTASGDGVLTVEDVGDNYVATFLMTIGTNAGKVSTFTTPKSADKAVSIKYLIPVADDVFNQMKQ